MKYFVLILSTDLRNYCELKTLSTWNRQKKFPSPSRLCIFKQSQADTRKIMLTRKRVLSIMRMPNLTKTMYMEQFKIRAPFAWNTSQALYGATLALKYFVLIMRTNLRNYCELKTLPNWNRQKSKFPSPSKLCILKLSQADTRSDHVNQETGLSIMPNLTKTTWNSSKAERSLPDILTRLK